MHPIHSHLTLAHHFWQLLLKPTDIAIDATCGNGHDTLFLTNILPEGTVIGIDIQKSAISKTQALLESHGKNALLYHQSHAEFPEHIQPQTVSLIVYNLGYLPGSDKTIKTDALCTLKSLKAAFSLIKKGGMISITAYPGHLEGREEKDQLVKFLLALDFHFWKVSHHQWLAPPNKPELFIIKNINS